MKRTSIKIRLLRLICPLLIANGASALPNGQCHPYGGETANAGLSHFQSNGSGLSSIAYTSEAHRIVIKFEEGDLSDALVTASVKQKIIQLAQLVQLEWPEEGVFLRITDAWDNNSEHRQFSLHNEGRAIDLTTSDRAVTKLYVLGTLAIQAGFDYVCNEGNHIHAASRD